MKRFLRCIGFILIAIGMVMLLVIGVKKYKTYRMQQEMIQLFQNEFTPNAPPTEENDYTVSNTSSEEENYDLSQDSNLLNEMAEYNPIAMIEIPTIGVNQVILEGVEDSILRYFIGHIPGTAMPGEKGNFVVAGHCYSDYASVFEKLNLLEYGDEVIITTKFKKFIYVVDDKFLVYPNQTEVLDKTSDATITLITCTPSTLQRVIVKGKLERYENL